jgi:chorismate mutase
MLHELRHEIDAINHQLVTLLGKRLEVAREIAVIKRLQGLSILDDEREQRIKEEVKVLAKKQGLDKDLVEAVFQLILDYTRLEMEKI